MIANQQKPNPDRPWLDPAATPQIIIKGVNFAPETQVVVSGVVILAPVVSDTQTISFTAPVLPSGRGILTVQNRAGVAQAQIS